MCKGLSVGDVVIASGAVRDEGTSRCYMPLEFPALADPCVVFALAAAAQKAIEAGKPDVTWHSDVGVVHTKDSLMSREFKGGPLADDHKKYMTTLEELGCLASEMESSMLFTLGHVHHVKTGCVCGIIGGGEDPFSDDASRKVVATERACQVVVLAMGILKRELCESVRRPSGQAIPLPLHRHLAETRAEATKHLVEAPRSTLQSWSWLLWALGTFFFLGMGMVQLLDLFFMPDSSIKFLTFVGMVACTAGMAILSLSGKLAIKAPSDDIEMQDARVQFLK